MTLLCLILFLLPLATQNVGQRYYLEPPGAQFSDFEDDIVPFEDEPTNDAVSREDGVAVVGQFISKGFFIAENKSHSPNITFSSDGNAAVVLSAVKTDKKLDEDTFTQEAVKLAHEGEPLESLNISLNSKYSITPLTDQTNAVLANRVLAMMFPTFTLNNNDINSNKPDYKKKTLFGSQPEGNQGQMAVVDPLLNNVNPLLNNFQTTIRAPLLNNVDPLLNNFQTTTRAPLLNNVNPLLNNFQTTIRAPLFDNVDPLLNNFQTTSRAPLLNNVDPLLNNFQTTTRAPLLNNVDPLLNNFQTTIRAPLLNNVNPLLNNFQTTIRAPLLNNVDPLLNNYQTTTRAPINEVLPPEDNNETFNKPNIDIIPPEESNGNLNDTLVEMIPILENGNDTIVAMIPLPENNETINNVIAELESNGNLNNTLVEMIPFLENGNDSAVAIIPIPEDSETLNETLSNVISELESNMDLNDTLVDIIPVLDNGNDSVVAIIPVPEDSEALNETLNNVIAELESNGNLNNTLVEMIPFLENGNDSAVAIIPIPEDSETLNETLSNVISELESNMDLNDTLVDIIPVLDNGNDSVVAIIPVPEDSEALNETLNNVISELESNMDLNDTLVDIIPVLDNGNDSVVAIIPVPEDSEALNETLNNVISELESNGDLNDTLVEIIPFLDNGNDSLVAIIPVPEESEALNATISEIISELNNTGILNETLNEIVPLLESDNAVNQTLGEMISLLANNSILNDTTIAIIPLTETGDVLNDTLANIMLQPGSDLISNDTLVEVIPILNDENNTIIAMVPLPHINETLNDETLNETVNNLIPVLENDQALNETFMDVVSLLGNDEALNNTLMEMMENDTALNESPNETALPLENEGALNKTLIRMIPLINSNGTLNETLLEMIPEILDSKRTLEVIDQLVQFLSKSNDTERVSDILSVMDQIVQFATNGSLGEIPLSSLPELEDSMNTEVPIVDRFVDIIKFITDMTHESVDGFGSSIVDKVPTIKAILENLKKLVSIYDSLLTPEDVEKIFESLMRLHNLLKKLPDQVIQENPDLGDALATIDEILLSVSKTVETVIGQDAQNISLSNERPNIAEPADANNTKSDVSHFLFSSEMILKNMREVLSTLDEVLENVKVSFDNPDTINELYEDKVPNGMRTAIQGLKSVTNSTTNLEIFINSLNYRFENPMIDIWAALKSASEAISSVLEKVDDVVKNNKNYNKEQIEELSIRIKQMVESIDNILQQLELLKSEVRTGQPKKNSFLKHFFSTKHASGDNLSDSIKELEDAINSNEELEDTDELKDLKEAIRNIKNIQSALKFHSLDNDMIEALKKSIRTLTDIATALDDPDIVNPISEIKSLLEAELNEDNSQDEEDEESNSEEDSSGANNKISVQFATEENNRLKNSYNAKIDISTQSISDVMPSSFNQILIIEQKVGNLEHNVLGNIQSDAPWSLIVESSIETLEPGLFDNVIGLRTLEVTYNTQLRNILEGVFTGTNIEILKLRHNHISDIAPTAFDNMEQLRVVDLTGNKLKVYTKAWFKNCPNLEVLTLASNVIKKLPPFAFRNLNLNHVEAIHLDNNHIANISNSIFSKQKSEITLKEFTLAHNKLRCLKNLDKILRPAYVDLSDNLIGCACGRKIADWQENHPETKVTLDSQLC